VVPQNDITDFGCDGGQSPEQETGEQPGAPGEP
jgi:hypothetical protein